MQDRKFIIANIIFQVFLATLRIILYFYYSSPPIKDSLPFHQPNPFNVISPH